MKLNKKQKRTATIASMAALLAVVLGMGGQTFAKYITTTETGTVQATVAKWGFVANAKATNMFKSEYAETVADAGGTDDLTVKANSGVVAPGTSGSMTIDIEGYADVDANVSFNTGATWQDVKMTDNSTPYFPILWTLKLDGQANPVTNGTLEAVETYFKSASFHYDAKISAEVDLHYTLSWNWAFKYEDTDVARHINDKYDTLLGLEAAGKGIASETIDENTTATPETTDDTLHQYTYVTSVVFSLGISITQAN